MGKAKPASRQALNRATRQGLAALIPLLQKGQKITREDIVKAIPKNSRSKYSTDHYLKKFRDSLQDTVKTFQAGLITPQIERKLNAAFKIAETTAKNAPPIKASPAGPAVDGWELFLVVQRWEWQAGIQAAQDEIFDAEAQVIVDISGDVETLQPDEVAKNITMINAAERKARNKGKPEKEEEKKEKKGKGKKDKGEANEADDDDTPDDYTPEDVTIEINRMLKQIRVTFK